jgi:copper transport protein
MVPAVAVAGVLLGAMLAMVWPAAPAAAHANLLSSDPSNGAVLTTPPAEVTLNFSESVRLVPDRVLVVGPDGNRVDGGDPQAAGGEVTIPLDDAAVRGTYLVSYRVISQDNHPVAGSITYSVGAPSAEPPVLVDGDSSDPAVAVAVSIAKYVGYAGLVLLVGTALILAQLWPRRLARRGAARLLWAGIGLVGLSTVAGLWLQAPYTTGGSMFGVTGAELREVLVSPFGTAHVVRLGVLTAVAVLLRPLLAGTAARADLILLAGLGVVGLGTWPVSGHPIASPVPAVSIAVQTVHLAAAAVWVGGLVVLAGFVLRLANGRELGVILPVWSQWAAGAVSVLMLAGLTQAVIEIGVPEALVTTSYGRLLLVKVGLFAVVITVAGYSRRLVRMRLAASRPGALRVAVAVEAALLAGVLVVSSILVQTTPGRTTAEGAELPAAIDFVATLEGQLYSLQVQVEPATKGNNNVHLYAYTLEGDPLPVEEWSASAALPAADVEPVEIPLLQLTDNHATGLAVLPVAGDWEFRFTLRLSEIDQASVAATVPIR